MRKLYVDKNKNFLYTLMKQVGYLKNLTDDTVEELCYSMKKEHFEAGADVFRVHDPIEAIYFIVSGKIDMFINLNLQDVLLETIFKGCTFGQYGVLGKYHSQFLGKTCEPTSMYILEKSTLKRLRKELRDLEDAMSEAERLVSLQGVGLVDFTLFRGTRKVSHIEIFKMAIRRAILINRSFSQNINGGDVLNLLKEMQARQRAGVSEVAEEQLPFQTPDEVEINKEMFRKLIEMVDVISKDNNEKRTEILKLETRLEHIHTPVPGP